METAGVVTKERLAAFIKQSDELGGPDSQRTQAYWSGFSYQPSVVVDQSLDPLSESYFEQQLALYTELSGRTLDQDQNELAAFDLEQSVFGANPYGSKSPSFVSEHAGAICEAISLAKLGDSPLVLDMGSGWGLSSELLAFMGCQVTAVDISQRFVDLVSRRAERMQLNIEAVRSSFDKFESTKQFDVVFFYECLHHATRPWELLRRCASWLSANGKIVISGEPINEIWWRHWGLRLDALSVYCISKFGWFESGWSLAFLRRVICNVGLWPTVYQGKGLKGAGVIVAEKLSSRETGQELAPVQIDLAPDPDALCVDRGLLVAERAKMLEGKIQELGAVQVNLAQERDALCRERDSLVAERAALLASTSWRVTKPVRWLGAGIQSLRRIPRRIRRLTAVPGFDLKPPLPLPEGISEPQLFAFITSVRVADAPEAEMSAYGTHDFRRFVYTWGLCRNLGGKCLELGANPYFTTMLLRKFTQLDLSLANYFGSKANGVLRQSVYYRDVGASELSDCELEFQHFNIESDVFPYRDGEFDLVIFAEIIEHLLNDPCKVIREIKRVLKPSGVLVLTTPNVARLENVARLIAGENIYDPYSGYGPYGRHNREYNRHELVTLLQFEGFTVEHHFTADVHQNNAAGFFALERLANLVKFREGDLGQYIFLRARNTGKMQQGRPRWLYRSYAESELV